MSSLQAHLAHYRAEHRTLGCKITHMIGIPLIALSIVMAFFDWRWAIGLFTIGWIFQLTGHRVFERNKPVLAADPANPMTYLSAVIFVGQEWFQLISGRGLNEKPLIQKTTKL